MSKRYTFTTPYKDAYEIVARDMAKAMKPEDVADILNQQDQRIAELEEQLKKKPKYNVGDRVYIINEDYEIEIDFVECIDIDTDGIEYYTEMYSICFDDCQLFKTKEEAEAKLKELGENND